MCILQVQIDWSKIEEKMAMEIQQERERPARSVPSSAATGGGGAGGGSRAGGERPARTGGAAGDRANRKE